MQRTFLICGSVTCFLIVGCGNGELNRKTALDLVIRDVSTNQTKMPFDAVLARPLFAQWWSSATPAEKIAGYQKLIASGLLKCQSRPSFISRDYHECASQAPDDIMPPTPSSPLFFVNAGMWEPVEVTGIVHSGEDSARADVRLTFRPRPFYEEHRAGLEAVSGALGDQVVHAIFQRYDNGWRLQQITH